MMHPQFEEKRKIFTNVITKKPIAVRIQTLSHLILGTVHIRPDNRLKDEINQPETFLAVTDATIINDSGEETCHCKFLAVNRAHIIWLSPEEEQPNCE
ncbi:MAG: hypothetical protein HPY45_01975 [Anaerolineae bacterium]|nr:hypothetical protein [Anaerolineae bacterium]